MIKYLKLSFAISIIASIFYLIIGMFLPFAFLLASGIYIGELSRKSLKKIKEKEMSLTIIGIINVLINPLGAILIFIALSKPYEKTVKKKIKKKIDPETRKLDIILKLGIFIIIFAGYLLATTSWELISDKFKLFSILLFSFIFYGLYRISETKLKIIKTTVAYWNIAMMFLVFALISIGVFATFGDYFAFAGEGKYLVYCLIFVLITLIGYLSDFKFKFIAYKYISIFSALLALNYLFMFFNLLINLHFLIFSLITFCLIFYQLQGSHWHKATEALAMFIMPILYMLFAWQLAAWSVFIVLGLFTIGNMLFFALNNEKTYYPNIIIPIFSVLIIFVSLIVHHSIDYSLVTVLLIGILSLLYITMVLLSVRELLRKYFLLILNGIFLIAYLSLIDKTCNIQCLSIASIILIVNLFCVLFEKKHLCNFEKYLQPLKVTVFIITLYLFLHQYANFLDMSYLTHILYLSILLMVMFIPCETYKRIYYIAFNVLFVIGLLSSFNTTLINQWMLIIGAVLMFVYVNYHRIKDQDKLALFSFWLLTITILFQFTVNDILRIGDLYASLVTLLLYGMLALYYKENKEFKIIVALISLFPVITLINSLVEPSVWQLMLTRTAYFGGIYVFNHYMLQEKGAKNAITGFLCVLAILSIIFTPSPYIGIYVGILALLLMYIGFQKERYISLFYIGVVTTIVNIIYQLKDIWTSIPIWIYLLIVGLSMIVFVTKKELNRLEK